MKQFLSFLLFLSLHYFSQKSDAQCTGTVLSLSAPTHSQSGITGSWTVPSGGPYKILITAKGAKGRDAPFDGVPQFNGFGGKGALMSGIFIVSSDQVLQAIAGAPGGNGANLDGGGGGGGARIQKNNGGDGTMTNTCSSGGTFGGCGVWLPGLCGGQ